MAPAERAVAATLPCPRRANKQAPARPRMGRESVRRFANPLLEELGAGEEEDVQGRAEHADDADFVGYGMQRVAGFNNSISHLLAADGEEVALTAEDEQLLREAFSVVDHDADGEVLHGELDAVLHVLGARPTESEVSVLLKHLDVDKDGDVELDDWLASVRAGNLQVQSHGATMDIDQLMEIRAAFVRIDDNKDGSLQLNEFMSAMRMLSNIKHINERDGAKIWQCWAEPIEDISCEMICWVSSFSEWSTEAPERDPQRKAFVAEFSRGVAQQLDIDPARVRIDLVLFGAASRRDQLTIAADKVSDQLADALDDDDDTGGEAQTVAEYSKDIATITVVIESLRNHRLIAAASRGDLEAARAELAKQVDVNEAVVSTGSTPLHVAAQNGHADVCALLLECGADISLQNKRGKTPVEIAFGAAAQVEEEDMDSEEGAKLKAQLEAVIAILEAPALPAPEAESRPAPKGAGHAELISMLRTYREDIRAALRKSDNRGLSQAQVGNCSVDDFHVIKFLNMEQEKVITWPAFVKGYAKLRHTPLGERLTLTSISELSSCCLHKLIGEKVHLSALYHPSISSLERVAIKMLSNSTSADAEYFSWQDPVADDEAEIGNATDFGNEEELFHGSQYVPEYVTSSPVDEKLRQFAENESNYNTSTRKLISQGVGFVACTGGLAALLSGLGEVLAIDVYQPDAIIAGEECPDNDVSTGSSADAADDCVEHQFILEAFLLISVPFMVVCTLLELGGMYYTNMHNCMRISKSVGLVLWPLDAGRVKIAKRIVQAAFEIKPSHSKVYGIDPLRDAPMRQVVIHAFYHKVKMGVTKRIVKLLVKRLFSRAGAREASALAKVSAFSMVPVGVLWNGVVAYKTAREARLRAVGTMVVLQYVDRLLPLNGIHDKAGLLSDTVCKEIIRAIACVAVAKREVHTNSDTLLRRVHERLLHLDLDLMRDEKLFGDEEGFGWGEKGFSEEDKLDDENEFLLQLERINGGDETHGERILRVPARACTPAN